MLRYVRPVLQGIRSAHELAHLRKPRLARIGDDLLAAGVMGSGLYGGHLIGKEIAKRKLQAKGVAVEKKASMPIEYNKYY